MANSLNIITDLDLNQNVIATTTEVDECHIPFSPKITIVTQNIRSIYANTDDLQVTLTQLELNCDIIILTECRFQSSKTIPQIPNYDVYITSKQINQNDGVAIYIKNNISHSVEEITEMKDASCLKLTIGSCTILGIYRPPENVDAQNFISSLDQTILTIKTKNTIIMGDININLINKRNEKSYEKSNRECYLNILSTHGIQAGHSLPTRLNSCLDHVMMKIDSNIAPAFISVIKSTITDHDMVLLALPHINISKNIDRYKTSINYDAALLDLQDKNLSNLTKLEDPQLVADTINESLNDVIIKNSTVIKIPKIHRVCKPWITPGILRCIRNRNKLQKKLRNNPFNDLLQITYKRYRNFCNNLIKKLKRTYDKLQLEIALKSKSNKSLWKAIKNITDQQRKKTDNSPLFSSHHSQKSAADTANTYFSSIGKNLAEEITNNPPLYNVAPLSSTNPQQQNSFVLLDTDIYEVQGIIMNLKSNSASGWDNIPTKLLKLASHIIVPIISHLINICFKYGVFPSIYKHAIILPIYKSGKKTDISNYRPIAILPVISKIIEKALNNRLVSYLSKFNILSPNQFGFQKGVSTEDAVCSLTNLIVEKLDSRTKCLAVFLDLKKAFDTVSIPILISKLQKIGIRDVTLNIFQDYLSNRVQQVKLNETLSSCSSIEYGVPQGSVLGPTLFLIYINDLCSMSLENGKVFTYADDTALVFYDSSWSDLKSKTETGLRQVASWLHNNLLTLNLSKTNYISFSILDAHQPDTNFNIKMHTCEQYPRVLTNCNCSNICKVSQVKYLGIILDQRLSWHPQIDLVISRLRKLIWIFKKLRHASSPSLIRNVYLSLAQSILLYCIPVWGGAGKTKFLELERAQRLLLKIMLFKPMLFSTTELYKTVQVLSVRKLYILSTILRRHKSTPFVAYNRATRRIPDVAIAPAVKTKFAQFQYVSISIYLYNKINKNLNIYSLTLSECKSIITDWLNTLDYTKTESALIK